VVKRRELYFFFFRFVNINLEFGIKMARLSLYRNIGCWIYELNIRAIIERQPRFPQFVLGTDGFRVGKLVQLYRGFGFDSGGFGRVARSGGHFRRLPDAAVFAADAVCRDFC
jgi:hypothetical protein